jgi:hypothetical protein
MECRRKQSFVVAGELVAFLPKTILACVSFLLKRKRKSFFHEVG